MNTQTNYPPSTPHVLPLQKRAMVQAHRAAYSFSAALSSMGFVPEYEAQYVTSINGVTLLFLVVDQRRESKQHSAAALQLLKTRVPWPVTKIKSTGKVVYAVTLHGQATLPDMLPLVDIQHDHVLFGANPWGKQVSESWQRFGHALVVGMSQYGKTNFLRLVVFQALKQGHLCWLGDQSQTAFPMLVNAPHVAAVAKRDQYENMVIEVHNEMQKREALFAADQWFPENLQQYNQHAEQHLPRVLLVLDEFNGAVKHWGSTSTFFKLVDALICEGLKFGIHVVLASQEWQKSTLGNPREQMHTIIGFRMANANVEHSLGIAGAAKIPPDGRGIAISAQHGIFKAYFMRKETLVKLAGQLFSDHILQVLQAAINQEGQGSGKVTQAFLKLHGFGTAEARNTINEWAARGWLEKRSDLNNAHYMTPLLKGLVAENLKTPQTVETQKTNSDDDEIMITNLLEPIDFEENQSENLKTLPNIEE